MINLKVFGVRRIEHVLTGTDGIFDKTNKVQVRSQISKVGTFVTVKSNRTFNDSSLDST